MELPGVGRNPVQEQRARWERQRSRTARELVATEQEYLARLELVATYFVAVLKAKRTLKPAVREVIFGPLEPLCSASRALLFHLEKGHLRPGLESLSRQLSLYIDYAENLTRAKKALQEQLRRNRAFSRFKELQERRPELKDCRLEDLLPLPLQRLHQ
ncbi:rho guanine nucleotide exchange factor 39 [Tiliqua scincoides]|uniref:rho guanine nucleotide exchange factor 39 n=1 Tax=Tiliqua scincoides TaxID=71010 RepID=UPI003462CACF